MDISKKLVVKAETGCAGSIVNVSSVFRKSKDRASREIVEVMSARSFESRGHYKDVGYCCVSWGDFNQK